ncbi:anaphase-promoting complex, cyclosome, subunit 3-domain-containing protein, partial [Syncephalis pseudoplumigaleata]
MPDPDLVERIRCWRHDAMQQHLYDSAIFWGDKVVSMTNDPNDVFWLAQVYYLTGQYARVEKLLTRKHLLNSSVACRFLAAQCLVKLKKWQAALEILGETNPFARDSKHAQLTKVKNAPEGIKLEASMCYLRGQVFLEQENMMRAKECFKEALRTDIKCYEAYQALVINQMMKQNEVEQEFLSTLDFTQLREEDAKLVKCIYGMKQRMPTDKKELIGRKHTLEREYGLINNVDVELSMADCAFSQGRFKDCLGITSGLLEMDQYHPAVLTTHVACLYELHEEHKLYQLGKSMVELFPEQTVTWFCVGCYYFCVKRIADARRFFNKACKMDTNYGPARIGYAHTFSEEGEYDQAIQIYADTDRLFPGSHLPTLFIGMQLIQQKNLGIAQEYLLNAAQL